MRAHIEPAAGGGVRLSGGGVEGPLGVSTLDLGDSVTVWIDPLVPLGLLWIDVLGHDESAERILSALIGADLAAELAADADRAAAGDDIVERDVDVELQQDAWAKIWRIAYLLWLEQYTLLPTDPRDFDIEIGLLASQSSALGTWELATERLERSRGHLMSRVDDSGTDVPGGRILLDALDEMVQTRAGGVDDETALQLHAMAEAHRGAHAIEALLRAAPARAAEKAQTLRAGGGDSAPDERTFSVDWHLVPRGFLDPGENTVSWSWSAEPEPLLTVSVAADPFAVASGARSESLMFQVASAADGEVIAVGALQLDADAARYVGTCRLSEPLAENQEVDVYSVRSERAASHGAVRRRQRASRFATRAYLTERQPDAHGAFSRTSLDLARRSQEWPAAAQAFASIDRTPGSPDARRADACLARQGRLDAIADGDRSLDEWAAELPALALAELTSLAGTGR